MRQNNDFENNNQARMQHNRKLIVHSNNTPIYDILMDDNFDQLGKELQCLETNKGKICIVSDTNVSSHYLSELLDITKNYSSEVETFIFQAGEDSKTLETVKNLYEHLIQSRFERNDLLIALGGGVVGDLTGYAAATYLRGIRFIQIPTSLLAMVDSSIGGKTGVDFNSYKNMVGAFHQPILVFMNINTLNTLTNRQYCSGFGEVIKYGLIKDIEFYQWLKETNKELLEKDNTALKKSVYRSCINKRVIVENDPTEKGERALLNFGHTIGHAIEKLMNFSLLHGECISIGMVAACYLSYKRGNITIEEHNEILALLQKYNLPISIQGLDAKEILSATKNDKKMAAGKIKFVILKQVGEAVIDDTITDEELLDAIQYIIQS